MNVGRVEEPGADGEVRTMYDSVGERESVATKLVKLARSKTELFHFGEDSFATIEVVDHFETYSIRSRSFRSWLGRLFFGQEERAANAEAAASAIATLDGYARFEGREHETYVRVGGDTNRIWLDLCDSKWRQIEVDASGWRVVNSGDSSIRFRRPHGMLPLPLPERGGSLDELKRFVNLDSQNDFHLVAGAVIGALHPHGPYPLLILHGEQGSAKSTATRVLRALIDPNLAPLRSEPREPRDLMIAARNGWMIAFDNISRLDPWLSDVLCRLSTGGGFSTRTLYTDDEETIFQAKRPTILNGIEELATRGDLLDRAIVVYLPVIGDGDRKDERTFHQQFEATRPRLLGALLDAVSAAIENLDSVDLADLPRMADFARWVSGAEVKLGWDPRTFINAYRENRQRSNELPLENPIAEAVGRLPLPWEGTATELLRHFESTVDDRTRKSRAWPSSGRTLSNALRRLAPNLRRGGISVEFRHSGKRRITLSESGCRPTSAPSTPPQPGVGSDALDVVDDEKQPLSAALAAATAGTSESSGVMGSVGIEEEL